MSGRKVSDIIEARLAQADTGGRKPAKKSNDDLFVSSTTLTYVAPYPTRTEEEAARAEQLQAEIDRDAARSIARDAMIRAHGCKGARCRSRRHAADRDVMHLMLELAGLRPYEPGNKVNRAGMGPRPKAAAG